MTKTTKLTAAAVLERRKAQAALEQELADLRARQAEVEDELEEELESLTPSERQAADILGYRSEAPEYDPAEDVSAAQARYLLGGDA
ncbi:hypothetical protein ACFM35_05000 [Microbacterium sp. P01]|uniref:hypothetical protein n=1 Tax=Microbacterium sp. P01 TaxID=3366261 RepID=UPI00366D7FB3